MKKIIAMMIAVVICSGQCKAQIEEEEALLFDMVRGVKTAVEKNGAQRIITISNTSNDTMAILNTEMPEGLSIKQIPEKIEPLQNGIIIISVDNDKELKESSIYLDVEYRGNKAKKTKQAKLEFKIKD